jgi:hypothetical protein
MSYSCPPDLPFIQLLLWYGKQVLASLTVLLMLGVPYLIILLAEKIYLRFKK